MENLVKKKQTCGVSSHSKMENKELKCPTNRINQVCNKKKKEQVKNEILSNKQYMQVKSTGKKAKNPQTKNWYRHTKACSDKRT